MQVDPTPSSLIFSQYCLLNLSPKLKQSLTCLYHVSHFDITLENNIDLVHHSIISNLLPKIKTDKTWIGVAVSELIITSDYNTHPELILQKSPNPISYLPRRTFEFLIKVDSIIDLNNKSIDITNECISALELVPNVLEYLSLQISRDIFVFFSIPICFAMLNISVLYNSPKSVISNGEFLNIIESCTMIDNVKVFFIKCINNMHSKNKSSKIAIQLGVIQRWINLHSINQQILQKDHGKRITLLDIVLMVIVLLIVVNYYIPNQQLK